MLDDWELLSRYVSDRSTHAIDELVRRHAGMVYATALREMRGDRHLAEDVSQAVFIVLMRKAASLSRNVVLAGWLFRVTRYAAADVRKAMARRNRHEQEAASMRPSTTSGEADASARQNIAPMLNDAIASLSAADRDAVVLKFFEGKGHDEVANELGITENNSRQRLSRAMEKLRKYFARRGIDMPQSAMGGALLAAASQDPMSSGLVEQITAALHSEVATATSNSIVIAKGAINMMRWARIRMAAMVGVTALALTSAVGLALMQQGAGGGGETGAVQVSSAAPTSQPTTAPALALEGLSPKQVMIAAWQAAMTGNEQGLADAFADLSPQQKKSIQQVARVMGAAHELSDAVAAKFGPEAAESFSRMIPTSVNSNEMRDGTEKIDGDTAVVDIGSSGPGEIHFVKVGNTWKVSPKVLDTMNLDVLTRTDQITPLIRQLAAEVEAGKYKTPQELQQATSQMLQRLRPQQMGQPPQPK